MIKLLRSLFVCYFGVFLLVSGMTPVYADTELDELKKLLQTSLTIAQIDQEIVRLTASEQAVTRQIHQSGEDMAKQEKLVHATREHVGKVLRSYYMGERESVWMLLLSAKSFSDMLVMYDYLSMIFQNDKKILISYQISYKELQATHKRLQDTEQELKRVKSEFIAQRERAAALQKEVDEQLQKRPEAVPVLQAQIDEVKTAWKEKGLPLFQTYFQAISEALQSLPELLSGSNQNKYLHGTTFEISDVELTQFFRSKNSKLANLTFRFIDGQFTATGQEQGIEASIVGRYTVEQDPNRLQFHVGRLSYNGSPLDATTNRALENDYNLSFSPEKYISLLQASEVTTDNGKLTIKLKIKLK